MPHLSPTIRLLQQALSQQVVAARREEAGVLQRDLVEMRAEYALGTCPIRAVYLWV